MTSPHVEKQTFVGSRVFGRPSLPVVEPERFYKRKGLSVEPEGYSWMHKILFSYF